MRQTMYLLSLFTVLVVEQTVLVHSLLIPRTKYNVPPVQPWSSSKQSNTATSSQKAIGVATRTTLFSSTKDDEKGTDKEAYAFKSQMPEFIDDFLAKEHAQDRKERKEKHLTNAKEPLTPCTEAIATHLVAIPMTSCDELLIELESVQRAIMYHCPILVHSCIVPSVTKMPLLYVHAPEDQSELVSRTISKHLKTIVNDHIFSTQPAKEIDDEYVLNNYDESEDCDKEAEVSAAYTDVNVNGVRPLTMTFQTLEIEGENNSILSTVGHPKDAGTHRLRRLVQELKNVIESQEGWTTSYPSDPNAAGTTKSSSSSSKPSFRPRVPFMKLPQEMNDNISRFKKDDTMDPKILNALRAENGGNGISPVYWSKWWDDVFGRHVRLRSISVYPRGNNMFMGMGMDEAAMADHEFEFATDVIALPEGNQQMQATEQKFSKYQQERFEKQLSQMKDEQEKLEKEVAKEEELKKYEPKNFDVTDKNDDSNNDDSSDLLMKKTRERLEKLYQDSVQEIDIKEEEKLSEEEKLQSKNFDDDNNEEKEDNEEEENFEWVKPKTKGGAKDEDDYMDEWTRERIRQTIAAGVNARKKALEKKKDLPPPEENPVFKRMREGIPEKVPEYHAIRKDTIPKPSFPSRESFVGFWRMVSLPNGLKLEDESSSDKCDNLILRVDGLTAGGPILDQKTRQKAAGGSWSFTEGEATEDLPTIYDKNITLSVRLIVPPKRERILVLQGTVTRMGFGASGQVATNTFGIPELEKRAQQGRQNQEELIYCNGDAYLEDAVTKTNRKNVGTFSMMKLNKSRDPTQFIVTVPPPIRIDDE